MKKIGESIEPEDITNDIYYNCTECPNLIEIMLIDEDKSSIKFKCTNKEKSHEKEMPIKEYLEKMKKNNKKKIYEDICHIHNIKYENYCFNCFSNICKECLKSGDHINHNKINIIEIQPKEEELFIIKKFSEVYQKNIQNLEIQKNKKIKELDEKKNILNEKSKKEIETITINNKKELMLNNKKYLMDIQNLKRKYENEAKKFKNKYKNQKKEINKKYKLLKNKENIINQNEIKKLIKLYSDETIKIDLKIEKMTNMKKISEIVYNTYKKYNNNYYNSININNILLSYYNNDYIKNNIMKNLLNRNYNNIIEIILKRKYKDNNLLEFLFDFLFKKNSKLSIEELIEKYYSKKKYDEIIEEKYYLKKKYDEIIELLKKNNCDNILEGENSKSVGICETRLKPKIYKKTYQLKTKGNWFVKTDIKLKKNFNDIIVGWTISDRWKDGTNGSWVLKYNPILKKDFDLTVTSQLFRGEHFIFMVYLMELPL